MPRGQRQGLAADIADQAAATHAQGNKPIVDPGVRQPEQVGIERRLHRRAARVEKRQQRVCRQHPPVGRKREPHRPRRQPQIHRIQHRLAAQLITTRGQQQTPCRAGGRAQHDAVGRGGFGQAALGGNFKNFRAEQQHCRGGQRHRRHAQLILRRAHHLRPVQPRLRFAGLCLRGRVLQDQRTRAANDEHYSPKRRKTDADAPRAAHTLDKQRKKRAGKAHRHPGHAGGPALFILVPLLRTGQHGRGQKRAAQSRRQAVDQQKQYRIGGRHQRGRKKSTRQQRCAPKPGKARAVGILQQAAHRAARAVGRHQDRKRQHSPPAAESIPLHDRLLEHAPRRRDAGKQLRRCPRRQNVRPAICFCHGTPLPCRVSMPGFD